MGDNRWLRDCRKNAGLNQGELAAQLQIRGIDISRGAISHWEQGRYDPPIDEPEFRRALADALRVDVRTLLRLAGYGVEQVKMSDLAERVAYIVDKLPEDKQKLALRLVEQLLDNGVGV